MPSTPKLVYALWSPDASVMHSAAWRAELAAAGARRVQVNVCDGPVAGALRLDAGATAVGGFVSLWDVAADAVTPVVARAARVVCGWEVEERRPLEPPEVWDGSRADALANVAMLRRPQELSVEEYRHRWLVDHTPVAIATQGTFGYVQNVVQRAVTALPDGVEPVAAIVEELFSMAAVTDMHAFYGTDGTPQDLAERMQQMMASVARFGADTGLDLVPTSRSCHALDESAPEAVRQASRLATSGEVKNGSSRERSRSSR
ncbi:EthD domain-containing protein [Nocardioides acrostichi]|uniref:EthD domain-containing protein n=1 Tax=Nocardioides acrostichi TaxID=2784339 RepID=A0A930Y5U7_9ACTN|nr:EthD domain-containing protein [Nocardioides acrostichi]MBF4160252.1 EthD domain-containing protein [Nocardioides acrostichi]